MNRISFGHESPWYFILLKTYTIYPKIYVLLSKPIADVIIYDVIENAAFGSR